MTKIVRISDYQYAKAYKAEIDVAHDCPIFDFMSWIEKYGLQQNLVKFNMDLNPEEQEIGEVEVLASK